MPVDGCFTEMKSGHCADVEATKLRSLFARRHVYAGNFGQVLVPRGVGRLSPHVADWRDRQCDQPAIRVLRRMNFWPCSISPGVSAGEMYDRSALVPPALIPTHCVRGRESTSASSSILIRVSRSNVYAWPSFHCTSFFICQRISRSGRRYSSGPWRCAEWRDSGVSHSARTAPVKPLLQPRRAPETSLDPAALPRL